MPGVQPGRLEGGVQVGIGRGEDDLAVAEAVDPVHRVVLEPFGAADAQAAGDDDAVGLGVHLHELCLDDPEVALHLIDVGGVLVVPVEDAALRRVGPPLGVGRREGQNAPQPLLVVGVPHAPHRRDVVVPFHPCASIAPAVNPPAGG